MSQPAPNATPEPDQHAALARLLAKAEELFGAEQKDRVQRAFELADGAHQGQCRKSGEPYILHPIEVAQIVADLHMDADSVVAALLHDVVEDTEVTIETVEEQFGKDVALLVESVTKLGLNLVPDASPRQRRAAESARAAETLRKMLLAMANDVRVMIIKLADRLHNMRTIQFVPPASQTRIANETLDVYAPLAARLGIWQLKWQLEDLSFKILHPREFQEISDLVAKSRGQREDELNRATTALRAKLDERGLANCMITSRPKHLHSIFNKIVKANVKFEEIYDLQAMRVITETKDQCYIVLGIVHDLWQPVPGLFFDYIALPKPNGYQSIHTKVMGPHGSPIEVQIRSKEMHEVAEFGVAAHFHYKEGSKEPDRSAVLGKQLFDWSGDSQLSSDFLRAVTTDLFSEQVFVFTPKGDVLDLPADSTPIDLAFRVHSELGLRVAGAKVNGSMVPLDTKLKNGDVVELVTRSNAQPSLDWLKFIKSQHARTKLRTYFRKRNREESTARGREALEKAFRGAGFDPRQILGEGHMDEMAPQFKDCENAQDVFARVGEGLLGVQHVVQKVLGKIVRDQPGIFKISQGKEEPQAITGALDNVMYRRAKCCMPVPGEDVVGYVSRGRGIVIHRRLCPNALKFGETEGESERLTPVVWEPDGTGYGVQLKIVSVNRQGLLMDISTIFGESKVNVSSARIQTLPNHTAEILVTVDVPDMAQLQSVMNKVGSFTDVISILRAFGKTGGR
ncbi:MAG: bifunctional (p)ppGpp synthetase/guanosine-3',5'-bis(diphosphate) 3'-pyrophosphohydrolase [Fimbriimonadaceae bacterium]